MTRVGTRTLSMPTVAFLACAAITEKPAEAASVDIFLIAEHTVPSSATGAPLSVTTSTVYQLSDLNSNFRARQATLVNNFTFGIDAALTFSSLNDPNSGPSSGAPDEPWKTDQNGVDADGTTPLYEPGAGTASYIDSEISTWDNSGIPGTTVDADEQIDFGRGSSVVFNQVIGGFTDLVISDLDALNPFELRLCGDAACSLVETVFAGFNGTLTSFLLGLDVFAASDTGVASEMDQTWLFRFSDPITDFVRVTEFDNRNVFTGARLQADFIGVGGTTATTPVPGPAGLPLLASGLGLLAWTLRRKKA